MGKDHIRELCDKYHIGSYESIRREYSRYKEKHIDGLEYVDAPMLKTYEYAFYLCYTGMKVNRREYASGMSLRVFKAACEEVSRSYVRAEEKKEDLCCNLYSTLHGDI
jgi:hypothetical protein